MEAEQLDKIFAALSDSTRRKILARLASGEATVNELADPFKISQPAISKHLKILQDADLISTQVDGQTRPRELKPETLLKAVAWIERYQDIWEQNYQRLDVLLEEMKSPSKKAAPTRIRPPAKNKRRSK